MSKGALFTSESVTEGHPDKVADRVSDAVLDAMLEQDPMSRVACETLVNTGLCVVSGEITSKAVVDIPTVARAAIRDIGYCGGPSGFDADSCAVLVALDKQSPDIAMGVDESAAREQGAGDQGMMFGYASDETEELMPLPILLAHKLGRRLSVLRKSGAVKWLQPDGKTQVTVEYDGRTPVRIDTIVISNQHSDDVSNAEIKKTIIDEVIRPTLPQEYVNGDITYHINPTGRFVVGGPVGDCGLTGRKIIVDTYGGMGRHGGGAFSGKDATKVDRSATYMARYIAKNIVAAGLAQQCEIQLAYAIGVAQPVSINVNTFGTSDIPEENLARLIRDTFDCRPRHIIETLNLRKPIFQKTVAYGHFGREDQGFRWEETDKADELRKAAGAKVAAVR
ncbi:MAG: methionine adenosyltransferase [Candidatus Hydrogenedentales bacterium]